MRQSLRELCRGRGWDAGLVYREEGRSAHVEAVTKRPVFHRLLEEARLGQFDVVVVHTLDRWSRNLKVTMESLPILSRANVGLVSITENIDYSSPQGRLFTQMLGAFAEYFSGSLATHVKKGINERARLGRHLGGIPFGYETCWREEAGRRALRCEAEHAGGVHPHPAEGPAVRELFQRYATGMTTLAELAQWLNAERFRTRNMHKHPDADGNLVGGPRLFTTASVQVILHNPFYAGKVLHGKDLLPGSHTPLTSQAVFDTVRATLKAHSDRSSTFHPQPERDYLLKGLVKCAWCRLPMWAQTYQNGQRYYREHRESWGLMACPAGGGSLPCHDADDQIGQLMGALILPEAWMDRVLARIQMEDEAKRVALERAQAQERLRRLGKAYIDGLVDDVGYERQKRALEDKLTGLVLPAVDAAAEAGRLLEDLPRLWRHTNETERRKLLLTILDTVYVETKEERRVVAIEAKPAFKPLFEITTTREGSGVALITQTPPTHHDTAEESLCSWWRRGRVELPVQ